MMIRSSSPQFLVSLVVIPGDHAGRRNTPKYKKRFDWLDLFTFSRNHLKQHLIATGVEMISKQLQCWMINLVQIIYDNMALTGKEEREMRDVS
jgi:hypothetical protein